MKRVLKRLVSVICCTGIAFSSYVNLPVMAANNADIMQEFYVSAEGGQNGDGTRQNPFGSLEEARDAVRKINNNMEGDIVIYISGGTYELDHVLELTSADSGTNGYKVRYEAEDGAKPIISGGHKISDEWTNEGNGIYSIPLNRDEKLRSFYVNGKRTNMTSKEMSGRGGYGEYNITAGQADWAWVSNTVAAGTKLDIDSDLLNTRNQEDIEIESRMTWNTSFLCVERFEDIGNGQMAAMLQMPYAAIGQSLGSNCSYSPSKQQTIYNVFEWLDEPGEFYFDKAEHKLYYYPREDENLEAAETVVPEIETLVRIQGEDLNNRVHNISFSGITFGYTDWNMYSVENSSGRVCVQGDIVTTAAVFDNFHDSIYRAFDVTPGAIEVSSASDIEFIGNTVKNTANVGISLSNDACNISVIGNIISDTGGSNLLIGHPQHMYIGDKDSGKGNFSEKEKYDVDVEGSCKNITITNNYFYNSCELFWGGSSIMAFAVSNMNMQYNHIEQAPYSGISLGWGWWNMDGSDKAVVPGEAYSQTHDNIIKNNSFVDTVQKLADSGAIYTLGDMPNTQISENFIIGIGQPDAKPSYHIRAIHTDEGSKNIYGTKNVMELNPSYTCIDCGNWGGGGKGPNTWDGNYSTSASYTSTGNYEPGTVIKNHHQRKNGFWDKEVFDIVRASGIQSEYLKSMPETYKIQDILLPTDFCINAGETIDLKINNDDIDGEIWLAPTGTESFTENETMSKAVNGMITIPTENTEYKLYVVKNGEASEPSKGRIVTEIEKNQNVIWAEDMDTSHIGSSGSESNINLGTAKNIDDTTKIFGIENDGDTLSYPHLNALDNQGGVWAGYVEKNIEQEFPAGKYTLYVACDTHSEKGGNRQYELTLNGKPAAVSETAGNSTPYSSNAEATLYIMPIKFVLDEAYSNLNIKLQAPSGGIAPNFIAMAIEKEEVKMDVWDTVQNEFTGEKDDYGIVWHKYSNDSKGGSYTYSNGELTINSNDGVADDDVLYGVSAVIKNIQPNTKYTISFKEKTELKTYKNNGFYLNTDTVAMTSGNKDPNNNKVTEIRNNKNQFAVLHNSLVSDTDWHDRTYEWTSGSGLPEGYDTYAAKFTFILRGATGTAQIKDLTITGQAKEEDEPKAGEAPLKEAGKDYNPKVHTGKAIDPFNTDDTFQYHYAGGTDDYNSGNSKEGKKYDAYLWVPENASKDTLRGLVLIKMNLIEVQLAYSNVLRESLSKQNFGILFIVDENDSVPEGESGYNYKNILQGMYTAKDYKGDDLFPEKYRTWDGKDASKIMNEIMAGIADASGYNCIADNTPVITIGHSAASPFGYRSGNWAYDRVIAQIDMKNGMWGDMTTSTAENDEHGYGMVPGIPSLQYAAQYTEHATGAGRDRSVCDARYHIEHQRTADTNQLVSHIIEWGSGHYDWSNNASYMITKYIEKAIEYRLNKNTDGTDKGFTGGENEYSLSNLTGIGYLMKPFEKDNGAERPAGYYQQNSWLSSGMSNNSAPDSDKKASFWYFDKEFADEINEFTNYAIPESPGRNDTKVEGKTYTALEPYMLMKNPSVSAYADTKYDFNSHISPFTSFNGSMYGSSRFINYEKMENPSVGNGDENPNIGATNTQVLKGYDTFTVDIYYMNKIPSVKSGNNDAYDGAGDTAAVPENTKSEIIPVMAPYELVESELQDMADMTNDGSDVSKDVAAVTRNTLRFHNNRVYYNAGCKYTNEAGTSQNSFAMIYSPEVWKDDRIVSIFKNTGAQMNVPYVDKDKGSNQTLTIDKFDDVAADCNPIDVKYSSSDADLKKYTDVFVNYGPARAVRTVNPSDGSYSWKIDILEEQIPDDAQYPIEVNIVASNLGKWEKVSGATAETSFYITKGAERSGLVLLERDGWIAETNSQQAVSGNNSVEMVLDGNESTIWHSKWGDASKEFNPDTNPIYLTVNMGKKQNVTGIRYTPRTKNSSAGSINGIITAYEIYVSDDNLSWTKAGDGNMGYTKNDSENAVKDIIFSPIECQYVKLVVKDNIENSGNYVGSCAELDLYTYYENQGSHPIDAEMARLNAFAEELDNLPESEVKTMLKLKVNELKKSGTVDGIETFLTTADMLADALSWIDMGMDDVYLNRIMKKLSDSDMSADAVSLANAELKDFYILGSEARDKWETNCGEEYSISTEELSQPLYTRVINAIERAKAKIDSNDGKDYKMLKELVSYMSGKYQYEGYENAFGMNADNCEIIVSNINFALSNLEKIENGELSAELATYKSGEMWLDTLGSKISAHGGQIIKRGDTYYWYGEDNKISYSLSTGVSCYSSKDLRNWKYEGIVFKAFDDGTEEKQFTKEFLTDNLEGTQGRIERPKVIYNEKTGKYVMWMHLEKDGVYTLSAMGVAVSDSPTGPFKWLWYGRPVCDKFVINGSYHAFFRDMNLFVDDDKEGYLFVSSENNQVMYAIRLNDDYTWIDADDLESSGATEADITEGKVIIPDMRVGGETGGYMGASYTYDKKSFTRYQLASGGAAELTKKKDESGNDVKDENGNQIYVSKRPDGRLCIPEYSDGRWARVGQNIPEANKETDKTETIVNNNISLQREAPAPVKIDGKYYIVTSGISGWYANASRTQVADNIFGPWTETGNPMTGAGPENNGQWDKDANYDSSFNSQSTCILQMPDNSYMYMGDRWKNGRYGLPEHEGVKSSTYVWLPITFENDSKYGDNTLKVRWNNSWKIDFIPDYDFKIRKIVHDDKIELDYTNISGKEADVICSFYDENGVLMQAKIQHVTQSAKLVFESGGDNYKIFVWDGIGTMKPLNGYYE